MRGSSTLARALVRGIRLKLWKTKPIFRSRTWARAASSSVRTSTPSRENRPRDGTSRQPTMFMSVDLPDPEGPMMATNSPRSTRRSTAVRAVTSSLPLPYVLPTEWRSMTGVEALVVCISVSPWSSLRGSLSAPAAEAAAAGSAEAAPAEAAATAESADGARPGPGVGVAVGVARHDPDRHDDLVAVAQAGDDLG